MAPPPPTGIDTDLLGSDGRASVNDDPIARFVLTVPVPDIDAARLQWLVLWDRAQRSEADANFLLAGCPNWSVTPRWTAVALLNCIGNI
ncbi:hypothetical protein GGR20_000030 [Devosia subaequoris]|uniref:Uncharacterized protein n=1 Tax=Devosia subaequoris TaxID=395930 RepID=A0A7W6NA13_9HYPH|nr:hypothetical protein [Devosia subaequoris]MBB4050412.1 hypothetical protein [Devosia subaequoris]MCP1208898.1 hypothetical protein [Devosia subaequoris]